MISFYMYLHLKAYLAHLKVSTSTKDRNQHNGCATPTYDEIHDTLKVEQNIARTTLYTPVKKSSLKSSNVAVTDNLNKYEDKYIKKTSNASTLSKHSHRSSVAFSVPDKVGHEISQSGDPSSDSLTQDSILDEDLVRWLEETSASDQNENFSEQSEAKTFPPKQVPNICDVPNESINAGNINNFIVESGLAARTIFERKLSKANLIPENKNDASKFTRNKISDTKSYSRSISFENSDLKSVPEAEEHLDDDRTLSTTTDRSFKSLSSKNRRGVLRSSATINDDSTSSSSQQYLSKRISRRNSYIYKDDCALVSAASSDDIRTVSQTSTQLERDKTISDVPTLHSKSTSSDSAKLPSVEKAPNADALSELPVQMWPVPTLEKMLINENNSANSIEKLVKNNVNNMSPTGYSNSDFLSSTSSSTKQSLPSTRHKRTKRSESKRANDRNNSCTPSPISSDYSTSTSHKSFKHNHKQSSGKRNKYYCRNCAVSDRLTMRLVKCF